ncbi:MAG: FixH family protein [Nocardioidaceae bacterium]
MTPLLRSLSRRGLLALLVAAAIAVLSAGPASAHAELVDSSPDDGARLDSPPAQVTLTFTGSVNLLADGIRLLDGSGRTVATPQPRAAGRVVTWPMPPSLPPGRYLVDWRVVSSDGHPVQGALSFGVGEATVAAARDAPAATVAPWPVVAVRLLGYLAFAVVAGGMAFARWCSGSGRAAAPLDLLLRWGPVGALLATAAGLLIQGPYVAGVSMSRLLDGDLLRQTLTTPFGSVLTWRLACYALLAVLTWRPSRLTDRTLGGFVTPAVAGLTVAGAAVSIAAGGHAAASGRGWDLVVDAVHVLAAGLWVGGLVALTTLGRSADRRTVKRFSRLAMGSVVVLVAAGVANSLVHLRAVDQLWSTGYGLVLLAKLAVVAAALLAAGVSRRALGDQRVPLGSVRLEVAAVVGVLAVTSLLSLTAPPPAGARSAGATATTASGEPAAASTYGPGTAPGTVTMPLGRGRVIALHVIPATTATGSQLHLVLTGHDGEPLDAESVEVSLSLPARDLGPFRVPVTADGSGGWVGQARFPFAGVWRATVTVEDATDSAVVTAGELTITD